MNRLRRGLSRARKRFATSPGEPSQEQMMPADGSGRIGDRSLRGSLIGMFLLSTGLALIVGVVGYFQVDAVRNILTERMTVHTNARFYVAQLDALVDKAGSLAVEYAVGSFEQSQLRDGFAETDAQVRSTLNELNNWTTRTSEEQARRETIVATYDEFFAAGQDLVEAKGDLETAIQSFQSNSSDFRPIREDIEAQLLGKGQLSLESLYWQMAYHEAQFLGQSRSVETLQDLNVDIINLRVALLGSLQELEGGQQVISSLDLYAIALSQVVAALHQQEESQEDVAVGTERFNEVRDALATEIQTLVDLETDLSDAALEAANTRVQATILVLIGLVVAAVGIGVGLGIFIAERLTRPIKGLAMAATSIAGGDLERTVAIERRDEIGVLAQAFNQMTVQLRDMIGTLEQRVAERTHELERRSAYLEATARVGRAASSILEPDDLIRQVVDSIRERFNLYYVGLFLLDETGEWAVLQAGTGSAGRAMKSRGHRIRVGEGMIGWSVAHGEARIASVAGEDAVRLATAELPDTRSEAALPLSSRGQILGALSVQHTEVGAFDKDTIAVLQTMADQVAVALDNAHLFVESQRAWEIERRAYGEIGYEAWRQMIRSRPTLRYLCDARDMVRRQEGDKPAEMVRAFQEGQVVQRDEGLIALPIKIHDRVLGALRLRKPADAGGWTPEEVALVEMLADQLSVALDSARLYEETQRRAAQERLVGEVTDRMRESLDIETVLKTTASEIRQALDLDNLVIRLASPETDGDSKSA